MWLPESVYNVQTPIKRIGEDGEVQTAVIWSGNRQRRDSYIGVEFTVNLSVRWLDVGVLLAVVTIVQF